MTDRREFARQQAEAFNARTMDVMRQVLDAHSTAVVEFAVSMHDRVEAAEGVLQLLGKCPCRNVPDGQDVVLRMPKELSDRLVQILTEIQSRPQ